MIFVAVRKEEASEGRKICEPASMWSASTIAGLTASRSCQRRPLPKFSSASFQRESPGLTTTTFSLDAAAGVTAAIGGGGGGASTTGAAGCEGATPRGEGGGGVERTKGGGGRAGATRAANLGDGRALESGTRAAEVGGVSKR